VENWLDRQGQRGGVLVKKREKQDDWGNILDRLDTGTVSCGCRCGVWRGVWEEELEIRLLNDIKRRMLRNSRRRLRIINRLNNKLKAVEQQMHLIGLGAIS